MALSSIVASTAFVASVDAAETASAPTVLVLVERSAEGAVDTGSLRRLISLEVGEIGIGKSELGGSILFRVVMPGEDELRVELWEDGIFSSARRVTARENSPKLLARRVALASGELAQGLLEQRSQASKQAELRQLAEEKQRLEEQKREKLFQEVSATAELLVVPGWGSALGTRLDMQLRSGQGLILGIHGTIVSALANPWQSASFGLGGGYQFDLEPVTVALTAEAGIDIWRSFDGSNFGGGNTSEWSPRLGVALSGIYPIGPSWLNLFGQVHADFQMKRLYLDGVEAGIFHPSFNLGLQASF